jgi:hypothetical protein
MRRLNGGFVPGFPPFSICMKLVENGHFGLNTEKCDILNGGKFVHFPPISIFMKLAEMDATLDLHNEYTWIYIMNTHKM